MLESDATAHLTDEQKTWKAARLRPPAERFEMLTPRAATPAGDPTAQATAELAAVVRRLLALGATPEAVSKAVADALAAGN